MPQIPELKRVPGSTSSQRRVGLLRDLICCEVLTIAKYIQRLRVWRLKFETRVVMHRVEKLPEEHPLRHSLRNGWAASGF